MTVEDTGATMLNAALYTEDLRLVDTWIFSNKCPSNGTFEQPMGVFEVPAQFATIQEAIDAAMPTAPDEPGGVVYVHPGVYNERVRLRSGVRLIGAGPERTILDGQGVGESLIDFSGAINAVVRGLTLRNVGARDGGCGSETAGCQGDKYAAAVYGEGLEPATGLPSCNASVVLVHNIIEANDLGVLLGQQGQAIIRNNLFLSNQNGILAAYQGDHALVMANTFEDHTTYSLAFTSGEIDFVSNVVTNSWNGLYSTGEGAGLELGCNAFEQVGDHLRGIAPIEDDDSRALSTSYRYPGNRDYRLYDTYLMQDYGCYDGQDLAYDYAPGAYTGPAGEWFQQEISAEQLRAMFSLPPSR